jgi:hypothetical protein
MKEFDEKIKEFYSNKNRKPGDLKKFAESIDKPYRHIIKRASLLGLTDTFKKSIKLSPEEIELLERNIHKNISTIRKIFKSNGFHRTESSLSYHKKQYSSGYAINRADAGIYSANHLSMFFNVLPDTVQRWIACGYLKATINGKSYNIKSKDIKNFIVNYTQSVDFSKADKYFLVDILTS